MKIRKDFIGCVIAQGHRLFAGDDVPTDVLVSDWLLDSEQEPQPEVPVDEESTEIIIDEDTEISGEEDQEPGKPTRADNKQAWFTYASELGSIEDGATIEDYSKADLIELVG